HPGKKMLFMGSELAQWNEWREDASLGWNLLEFPAHQGIQRLLTDLNHLYQREPALHEVEFDWPGFQWLEVHDADASVLAFIRRGSQPEDFLVIVCNFTPMTREDYRVGVPEKRFYQEIMNTDSCFYGGSNVGNGGGVVADPVPWNDQQSSIKLILPPLSALVFKPKRD
ncbi:MAG: alpha amylase C-terminal domain-containing protein, partial [Candidatus Acidiferrales bacterium]